MENVRFGILSRTTVFAFESICNMSLIGSVIVRGNILVINKTKKEKNESIYGTRISIIQAFL